MKKFLRFLAMLPLALLCLGVMPAVASSVRFALPPDDGEAYSEKLLVDPAQISSNQPSSSEGIDYGLLIDNNTATYWQSNWNDPGRGDLGYHYLQFDFAEPLDDTVIFTYTMRQDAVNFNAPTDFVITGSADGQEYSDVRAFSVTQDRLPSTLTATPYTVTLSGVGGLTSLRMVVRSSTGGVYDGYNYFALSEVQFSRLVHVGSTLELDNSNSLVSGAGNLTVGNLASGTAADLVDGSASTAVTVSEGVAGESFVSAFRPGGFTSNMYICWTDNGGKITAADVLVSSDGESWKSLGSFTPQAEPTLGMQCVIVRAGSRYNYVRLVPTATEASPVPTGSPAFGMAEFAIYQAIEILDLPLQTLVDSYTLGADDYDYGTDPGYVGNKEAYANFYNTYSDALMMLSSGTASEEEMLATSRNLQRYKAQAEASINVPQPGKYYYIRSAYTVFADKSKTVGMYAPRSGNYPGWHISQPNVSDVWTIEQQPSGNYAIKSVSTGGYINHVEEIDVNNSPLVMSPELETEQVLVNVNYTGQFNIRAASAQRYYNSQEANVGEADEGPISSWTDTSLNGECTWYITEVPADELSTILATANRDRYAALVNSFNDNYDVGPDPGQYRKDLYDAAKAEYEKAKAALEAGTYTEEQYAEAYTTFKTAVDNLNSGQVEVETGYYAITDRKWSEVEADEGRSSAAWYTLEGNDYLNTNGWELGNPSFIWYVEKLPSGNYTIRNVADNRYVHNTDLISQSAAIRVAESSNVEQTIKLDSKSGKFEFSNTAVPEYIYHNGRGISGRDPVYLVYENTHVTWAMHRFSEEQKDSIINAYPQMMRTDSLDELVNEVTVKINSAYEYDFDLDNPVVTDASQFYCNNLSTEGSLGALIDNNFDTHFISAYNAASVTSENAYHYLRVDAGEGKTLPEKFGLHWRTRGSSWNNMYRPIDVIYSVSDDAVTWVEVDHLTNPAAGFPVTAEVPEYTSLNAVSPGRGYRYFKFTVLATNTGDSYNGYPWFTFSEFNLYPVKDIKETSPAYDPEVSAAIEALEPVLEASRGKVEANTVTSQDIATLRAAYNELLLVWKDTTDLYKVYSEAASYYTGVSVGDGELFTFPAEKVEAFENAFFNVEDARPFTDINQRTVAALDTALTNALADLKASMFGPDPNTWYLITSMDETKLDGAGNPLTGQYAWMGGFSSVDGLGYGGTLDEKLGDTRIGWKFEPTDVLGQYRIICCGSGWPMDKGNIFELVPLGDGQFAMQTVYNGQYYTIQPPSLPGVPFGNITPQAYGDGSWMLEEAPFSLTQHETLNLGRVAGYVLPYTTYEMPSGLNGEGVGIYSICGYQTSADGSEVTAINLVEFPEEYIPAATPFVMIIEPGTPFDREVEVKVDMKADIYGEVTQELKFANGLIGTFTLYSLPEGMIYLTQDSAFVEPAGFGVSPLRAYIDVNQIVPDASAEPDMVVYVSGKAGLINGIHDAVFDASKPVDVYTTDGVLLRRNVLPAKATEGLSKGIYIVGRQKVLVR